MLRLPAQAIERMKHCVEPSVTRRLGTIAVTVMVGSIAASDCAQSAGTRRAEPSLEKTESRREQHLLIRSERANVDMRTLLLLPAGRGPHPLAVVNHGSTENAELRAQYPQPAFE